MYEPNSSRLVLVTRQHGMQLERARLRKITALRARMHTSAQRFVLSAPPRVDMGQRTKVTWSQ